MRITRRLFAGGLAMAAFVPGGRAASDDRALLWSAEAPGQPKSILFAYERVGAARVPDIVRDGERFALEQDRLVVAMPNVKLGEASMDRTALKPLLGRLSPPNRDRVQALLTLDGRIQTLLDKASGVELGDRRGSKPEQPQRGRHDRRRRAGPEQAGLLPAFVIGFAVH